MTYILDLKMLGRVCGANDCSKMIQHLVLQTFHSLLQGKQCEMWDTYNIAADDMRVCPETGSFI